MLAQTAQSPAGGAPERVSARSRVNSDLFHSAQALSSTVPARVAALCCIVLGLCHILNLHPIGDGLWFWYASLFREGHRLYQDMHLNLPPFFILVTAAQQSIFGTSWLASKIPATLQLLAYVLGLYLVSLYAPVRAWTRAFLIAAAFLLTIAVSYARFDDYHIPTHLGVVFSAWLLLRYRSRANAGGEFLLAVLLGMMGGISTGNRFNDGATLVTAQLLLLPLFVYRRRLTSLCVFLVTMPATLALLVLLTGDTLSAWFNETIIKAAAIKGGTGNILLLPFLLAPRQLRVVLREPYQFANLCMFIAVAALLTAIAWNRQRTGRWITWQSLLAFLGIPCVFLVVRHHVEYTTSLMAMVAGSFLIVSSTVLVLFLVFRAAGRLAGAGLDRFDPVPLLLLLPFAQLLGAAMTSGIAAPEYTPAIGIMLLFAPICLPVLQSGLPEAALATTAFLFTALLLPAKVKNPYYWHHFYDAAFFADREWYRHPAYGPMYIERGQADMMQSFCSTLHKQGSSTELLALPYPYPNYFCAVPPWHGYVQTWYDTSSAQTIQGLMDALTKAPPEWIMYQRGLDMLRMHEYVFLGNRPLPHRALDQLIRNQISSGTWTIARQQCFGGADWILIHTRPASPDFPGEPMIPSDDATNLCARTDHGFLR